MPPKRPSTASEDRDVRRTYTAPRGVGLTEPPENEYEGFDGHTPPVQDPETFRAIRAMHAKLERSSAEAAKAHGALVADVSEVKTDVASVKMDVALLQQGQASLERTFEKFGARLDDIVSSNADLNGQVKVMLIDRHASMVATVTQQTTKTMVSGQVNDTLAEKILDERKESRKFKNRLWLKIISGVFSGTALVALITALAGKC